MADNFAGNEFDEGVAYAYAEEGAQEFESGSTGRNAASEGPTIDVELDSDADNMVWEVETEPAPGYTQEDTYYSGRYNGRPEQYEEVRYERKMNKHLFTWLFSFFFGMYGVDRIIRGQTTLGIIKLCTLGGLGMWYLADLGIAIYKSYFDRDADMQDDLHFDYRGRYV